MTGKRLVVFLFVVGLLVLQGCIPQQVGVPQTGADAVTVAASAPQILSVEVLRSSDPQDISVIARAVLPDACYRLSDATVNRQGREFTVNIPAEKVASQGCGAAPLNQDRIVRLTTDALAPGNYIVLVNGYLGTFSVSAPVKAAQPVPTTVAAASVGSAPAVSAPAASAPAASAAAASAAAASAPAASSSAASGAPASASAASSAAPSAAAAPTQAPSAQALKPAAAPAQLELPPAPTPTAVPLALAVGKDPAGCVNKAAFYADLTVPDGTPFEAGSKFTKTWLVMNVGSCTWSSGYQLVFAGGDPLGASQKVPLAQAAPRQVVQVSVDMTAPVPPLTYESDWAIQTPDGYTFGVGNPGVTPLSLKINVAARPAGLPSGLECGALRLKDMEQQVLEQINNTRATYGLYPLKLVEDISQTALKHSLEMACFNRESHRGLDGNLYNVRLQSDNILFATSNEIIYSGNGGPKGSITWWMNSPIHKPIVLSNKYTEIGIGFVYYDKNPYKQRITVDFIHP